MAEVHAGSKYHFEKYPNQTGVIPRSELASRVRPLQEGSALATTTLPSATAALGSNDHLGLATMSGDNGDGNNNNNNDDDDDDDDTCAICIGDLPPRAECAQLPCGHRYCAGCYGEYKASKAAGTRASRRGLDVECPLCRAVSRQPQPPTTMMSL